MNGNILLLDVIANGQNLLWGLGLWKNKIEIQQSLGQPPIGLPPIGLPSFGLNPIGLGLPPIGLSPIGLPPIGLRDDREDQIQ